MNVLVAGATGKTGRRLIGELKARGHEPIALVRPSSDTNKLPGGTKVRHGDLTDLEGDVCEGCDAVIFAAGSGGDTGSDLTDKVDRDGAMSLIDQAVTAEVKRFVMLSSAGAGEPADNGSLAHYLRAKHDADEHLKASSLAYSIVRPVALSDDDGDRDIRLGDDVDLNGKAARGDVAAVLADALESPQWRDTALLMQSA